MSTPTITVSATGAHRWRIVIDSPPTNLVTPGLVRDLHETVRRMVEEPDLKVAVFESANEHFWLNHFDLAQVADFPVLPDGTSMWTDTVVRLSTSPVVSIAKIRGRARGGGDELLLACDLRYASRERAVVGQIEVGTGILPGGGATERLPRLIGRDRALEAVLSSEDYSAELAERYGWVTRAIADDDLDGFVDAFTARLAGFDGPTLAAAKAQINRAGLPPERDLHTAYGEFLASMGGPGFRRRLAGLRQAYQQHGADLELNLGHHLGGLAGGS